MRILINTSHQRFGGAIQVALSLIYECIKFSEHEFIVWVGPGVKKSLNEKDFPINFHFQYFDFGPIHLQTTIKINNKLRFEEKKIQPDVIISTSGPTYFHSKAPQIIGFNLPLYIYPDSPYVLTLPIKNKIKLWIKKQLHFYFFKRDAIAYIVQTEDVNRRVKKSLGTKRVFTITNTYNNFYVNWKKYPNKLSNKKEGSFRMITISAYYPHKNLEKIIGILSELDRMGIDSVEFVLTLSEKDFQNTFGENIDKRIINVGPIKPDECPSLYSECDCLFLPTLAECFSASYPEAMIMQKPIITSDLDFAHAICSDAALYFNPMDQEDISKKIILLIESESLRKELIQKGLRRLQCFGTAEQRAEQFLEICIQTIEHHKNAKA